MTTCRSELIYADIEDWEIITQDGDELIEQMEEHGLATDYADEWSDRLQELLVRKYRVPDGPERVFVQHQIDGMLVQAVKARACREIQEGRRQHGYD